MAIVGTGIDLVEIKRIASSIKRHGMRFLERVYTEKERAYCKEEVARYAGRFAAKEAVAKSLGVGIGESLGWQDIEILSDQKGVPRVHLSQQAKAKFPNTEISLSISHCRSLATAVAIRTTA